MQIRRWSRLRQRTPSPPILDWRSFARHAQRKAPAFAIDRQMSCTIDKHMVVYLGATSAENTVSLASVMVSLLFLLSEAVLGPGAGDVS